MSVNPSSVARQALRQLAAQKIPPTPENYSRAYAEIASPGAQASELSPLALLRGVVTDIDARDGGSNPDCAGMRDALDVGDWSLAQTSLRRLIDGGGVRWGTLLNDLLQQLDARTPGITAARKRDSLAHVLAAFGNAPEVLRVRLRGLVDSWSAGTTAAEEAAAAIARAAGDAALEVAGGPAPASAPASATTAVLDDEGARELHNGLLRIVHVLTINVAEMLGDDPWLQGQFKAVAEIAAGPLERQQIVRLERALREIVFRQSTLKQSMDEAKTALRAMTATFIDRLAMLAADAGEHSERLDSYAAEIERTQDLGQLSSLVVRLVQDTRGKQSDFGRMHAELLDARRNADEYSTRVLRLERELATLSDRLHEDQLTELLNRRGLDRQFEIELARSTRTAQPLCVCLLDIDDFKRINDTHGHQVGDQALVHLAQVLRQAVRPSDVVARFGGEEFVILLPSTRAKEAESVMARMQRDLTRRYFLHRNERLLVTFSAGVTEGAPGETADELMSRADRALYQAKQSGKNRVIVQ
ncbi:MAG: GGDEF domain-containing protein [Casimicrobiaceae bacterium]